MGIRSHHPAAVVALAAAAFLPMVVGCAAVGEQPLPHSSWNIPTEGAPTAGAAVAYPMPDLGPSPAPVPPTTDQQDSARAKAKAQAWKEVLDAYPDAVRPHAEFEAFTTPVTTADVLSRCYTAAGVGFEVDRASDGTAVGAQPRVEDEKDAISVYVCRVRHPDKPYVGPTKAQIGYIYDYLTEFIVPCYEANGITNEPAPSREYFVAKWPKQSWFPTLSTPYEMGGPEEEAIARACPMTK